MFITDSLLTTLMCAPRSVYSWDILATRAGDKLFFDKRDGSNLDLLTVAETAPDPLPEDKDAVNGVQQLSVEATAINQNFSQQASLGHCCIMFCMRDRCTCQIQWQLGCLEPCRSWQRHGAEAQLSGCLVASRLPKSIEHSRLLCPTKHIQSQASGAAIAEVRTVSVASVHPTQITLESLRSDCSLWCGQLVGAALLHRVKAWNVGRAAAPTRTWSWSNFNAHNLGMLACRCWCPVASASTAPSPTPSQARKTRSLPV